MELLVTFLRDYDVMLTRQKEKRIKKEKKEREREERKKKNQVRQLGNVSPTCKNLKKYMV